MGMYVIMQDRVSSRADLPGDVRFACATVGVLSIYGRHPFMPTLDGSDTRLTMSSHSRTKGNDLC